MTQVLLYISGAILIIHGMIELAPLLLKTRQKSESQHQGPDFIFAPLKNNQRLTIFFGVIIGILRIIAAVGILFNLMWGLALGIIISIITIIFAPLFLPFGIMDGILSGIVLITLLMAFFGNKPII